MNSKPNKITKNYAYEKVKQRGWSLSDILAILAPSIFLLVILLTITDNIIASLPVWLILGGYVSLVIALLSVIGYMFQIKSPGWLSWNEHSSLDKLEPSAYAYLVTKKERPIQWEVYELGGIRAGGVYLRGGGHKGIAFVPRIGRIILGGGICVFFVGLKFTYEELPEQFKEVLRREISSYRINDPVRLYLLPPRVIRYIVKIFSSQVAVAQLEDILTNLKMTNSHISQLKNQLASERAYRDYQGWRSRKGGYEYQPQTEEERKYVQ